MLNISYDSQGKVSTIHIQIDNYFAQISYNSSTQSIDWDLITYEPTRQSIQSAWDAWAKDKDLSIELRDRPDLAPIPVKPNPDWGKFKREILLSSTVYKIATQSTNQYAVDNFRAIITPLGYNELAAENYPLLQKVWGYIIDGLPTAPTQLMVDELKAIAFDSYMIFSFDSSCKIALHT